MRPSHRLLLGFLTARLIFGIVFLASAAARWPVLWYFPLQHRWELARAVRGVAMDWYGRSMLALVAGAFAGFGAYAIAGMPAPGRFFARRGVVEGIAHFGALMLLNDVLFYALALLTRHVTPVPIPSWYCPQ